MGQDVGRASKKKLGGKTTAGRAAPGSLAAGKSCGAARKSCRARREAVDTSQTYL
jgi:hypothetical protein